MSSIDTARLGTSRGAKSWQRDWILLPAIGILSIGVLSLAAEVAMQIWFREGKTRDLDCLVVNDASTGARGVPGCSVRAKIWETPPIEYRFNRQGYRANEDFGPKQPGVYRIVLVGPSSAMGYRVPVEKGYGALLSGELSRDGAGRVEVLNEALPYCGGCPKVIALRLNRILDFKPDLVLWVLDPWDVRHAPWILPPDEGPGPEASPARERDSAASSTAALTWNGLHGAAKWKQDLKETIDDRLAPAQVKLMIEHYLYQSAAIYAGAYLRSGEDAGYLKSEPAAVWKEDLRQTEESVARISGRLRQAGVSLAVAYVPERAQVAMAATGLWPPGYDPYRFDNDLRAMIARHGAAYIDLLPDFQQLPEADKYFFPVDNHPNIRGHAMLAAFLARHLTGGAVPALSGKQPEAEKLHPK